jgi:hypothetical protein
LLLVVSSLGYSWLTVALVVVYLFMVVYSWTIAPLSRWLMQRKLR